VPRGGLGVPRGGLRVKLSIIIDISGFGGSRVPNVTF